MDSWPPFVDTHAHFGRTVTRLPIREQTPEAYAESMPALNIASAFAVPVAGYDLTDGLAATVRLHDAVAHQCRDDPVRFPIGLAMVEPRLGIENATREVGRAMHELGLRGICVVPRLSGGPLGEGLLPALRILDEVRGMFLVHTDFDLRGPQFVAEQAAAFPRCAFVLSHAQRFPFAEVLPLQELDNVYADIAQNPSDQAMFDQAEALIAQYRSDRILWGSDSPYYSTSGAVDNFRRMRMPDVARERIASRNALDLIASLRQ